MGMALVWLAGFAGGAFLVYRAFRDEVFRQNRAIFYVSFATFVAISLTWSHLCLRWMKEGAEPYTLAFTSVLGGLPLGILWGGYFAMHLSDRLSMFFYRMLGGDSGQVIKTYDRAVAMEINARYREAIAVYLEYAGEDPADYAISERIARCHLRLGQARDAVVSLQQATEVLFSASVRLPRAKKREEFARLLFLQRAIRARFGVAPDQSIEKALSGELGRTRFGRAALHADPLATGYLEVWSDIPAPK